MPPVGNLWIVRSPLVAPHLQLHDAESGVTWSFDQEFLGSNWSCLWGRGCEGILDTPSEELGQGCCSVGAELLDENEAKLVSALAATADPDRFQFHREAASGVLDGDAASGWRTKLVDNACVFLNRPGFSGGPGCVLHLEAEASGESPIDWKPSVCWQLPLRVERNEGPNGPTAELRRWGREDWGSGGAAMAWCCTEQAASPGQTTAFNGTEPVVDSMAEELKALVGNEVYVELRRRTLGPSSGKTG